MGQDFRRSLNIDGAFGICRMRKKRMSLVHKSNSIKNGMTVWTIIDTCRCMERAMGLNLIGTRTILSVMKQIYIKHQSKMHQKTSICEFHLSVNNQLDAFLSISNEKKIILHFLPESDWISLVPSPQCVYAFFPVFYLNQFMTAMCASTVEWQLNISDCIRTCLIVVLWKLPSIRVHRHRGRGGMRGTVSIPRNVDWNEKKNRNENETAYSAIVIVIP